MSRFFQRLELHGFKSFCNKTTIEFLDGITVVVGPNGCGKSNVLDGIRWVLGETSAKSLRGGRMGDVVFRGSSSQKPSGFAQATLTCSNESRLLKLDQDEVAVGRRLFANGEAQYFVNKQVARMRDVHELFLDTGLGADGYSIIEQGRIGELVAAKPDQRREIFEEAAGISRYKARREETNRKLLRTEEDLLRLFDHVTEVEKQAGSLYRQAKKAERYRRYMRRLRRVQKRSILLRHEALSKQRVDAEARLAEAKERFDAAAAKLAQAEAAQAETARKVEAFQRELAQLNQERFARQSALEREKHRGEMLDQRRQSLLERAAQIDREMESANSRATILGETLHAVEADLQRERGELHNAELLLRDGVQELDTLRSSLEARTRQLHQLRGEVSSLNAKRQTLENDRRVAQAFIDRLTQERDAHAATLAELERNVAAAEAEHLAHKDTATALKEEVGKLRADRKAVLEEIAQSDRSHNELAQRLQEIGRELQRTASRLQALQELEDSFEGYFRGVKEIMTAAQRGQLKGIVGVVTNLIEVPKELDVAMEIALGGDLQDIVTERVDHAKAAIQMLKDQNWGRATFLPLDFLHTDFPSIAMDRVRSHRGVIGLARELVKYDAKIEAAVRYLFGNTVIVEDLDVGVALEREGVRTRYVSLQGDIINPRGVISGGSHKTRGLLSRQREIQQLRAAKQTLEGDFDRLTKELQGAKDKSGALHARAAELQQKIHEAEMAEARAERDLHSSEQRWRERRNQLASAQARTTQQATDLRKHTDTVERCDAALGELATLLSGKEETLNRESADGDEAQQRLQQRIESTASLRADAQTRRERVSSMERKVEELRREHENAGGDQARRKAERLGLVEEAELLVLEREETDAAAARLIRERDELDAKIGQLTQDNETIVREGNALRAGLQGFLRDRNETDTRLRETELKAAEIKMELEYIEREASEEFEATIEQIAADVAAKQEEENAGIVPMAGDEEGESSAERTKEEEEDDATTDPQELRRRVAELRERIQKLGPVNEAAIEDYKAAKERLDFLTAQRDDLVAAKDSLRATIAEIDETTKRLFNDCYETIRKNFIEIFRRLFNGGTADLVMVPCDDKPEPGIDIFAQPPGKNIGGSITLMSGGEKAMTAVSLMLALFKFRPSPVCILDEVDAPLDDVNVGRFCDIIREYSRDTQFLVITHNKLTMGLADTIYGVTMQEPGVSKLVSVRFDRIDESGLLAPAAS